MVVSRHGIHSHLLCLFGPSNARFDPSRRAGSHPPLSNCPGHLKLRRTNSHTEISFQHYVGEYAFRLSSSHDVRLSHTHSAGSMVFRRISAKYEVASQWSTCGKKFLSGQFNKRLTSSFSQSPSRSGWYGYGSVSMAQAFKGLRTFTGSLDPF